MFKGLKIFTVLLFSVAPSFESGKEIEPLDRKGNQPWIFIGRTAAKVPIFWPRDAKS